MQDEIRTDTPAEIPERTGNIVWHEFSRAIVGMDGPHLVAAIEKVDGAPVEAYGINYLRDMFVSADDAKLVAEKGYKKHIEFSILEKVRRVDLTNGPTLQDMRDLLFDILSIIDLRLQAKKDAAAGSSSDQPSNPAASTAPGSTD